MNLDEWKKLSKAWAAPMPLSISEFITSNGHYEIANAIAAIYQQRALHPAEEFDRLTALGYKLNLLTGEYYK